MNPEQLARLAYLSDVLTRRALRPREWAELVALVGVHRANALSLRLSGHRPTRNPSLLPPRDERGRFIWRFPPPPIVEPLPPIESFDTGRKIYVYRRMVEFATPTARQRRYHPIRVESSFPLFGRALERAFGLEIAALRRLLRYNGLLWYIDPGSIGRTLEGYVPFGSPLDAYDFGGEELEDLGEEPRPPGDSP